MVVEEMVAVEADELPNESPITIVRRRFDREVGDSEGIGKIVKAEGHLAHHAESAASTAFQRPEQIGIRACVRDTNLTIRSDYFGFEQALAGSAVVLREASKAAALNQTRQAYCQASATLNVFAPLGRNRVVR